MSLADLMSGARLDWYAQVSLLLFLGAFLLIVWRVLSPRFRDRDARVAALPLEDDAHVPASLRGE